MRNRSKRQPVDLSLLRVDWTPLPLYVYPCRPTCRLSPSSQPSQSPGHDRNRQLRQTEEYKGRVRHEEQDERQARVGGTRIEWEFLDTILEKRQRQQHGRATRSGNEKITEKDIRNEREDEEEGGEFSWEGSGGSDGPNMGPARRLAGEEIVQDSAAVAGNAGTEVPGGDADHIPTLAEVVDALKDVPWKAPTAFRPLVSLCGQMHSPFDSIIPFERLQVC